MNSKIIQALYSFHMLAIRACGGNSLSVIRSNIRTEASEWGEEVSVRNMAFLTLRNRSSLIKSWAVMFLASSVIIIGATYLIPSMNTTWGRVVMYGPSILGFVAVWLISLQQNLHFELTPFFTYLDKRSHSTIRKLWSTVPAEALLKGRELSVDADPLSAHAYLVQTVDKALTKEDAATVEIFDSLLSESDGKTIGEILQISRTV